MKSHDICSRHLCQLPGLNFNLVLLESVAHCEVFPIAPIHAYLICWVFALRGECGDESSFPLGHASSVCEAVRALPALDLVRMPPFPPLVAGRSFIYYSIFLQCREKIPTLQKVYTCSYSCLQSSLEEYFATAPCICFQTVCSPTLQRPKW